MTLIQIVLLQGGGSAHQPVLHSCTSALEVLFHASFTQGPLELRGSRDYLTWRIMGLSKYGYKYLYWVISIVTLIITLITKSHGPLI